jgi:kynurenine 3-monooxygenase
VEPTAITYFHAGRSVGLVLFKADDQEVLGITKEEDAAKFLQREFPNTFELMPQSEVKAFAERPPGQLPTFKYVAPDLHYQDSIVLLGDCIHTVKPYFGLGANVAMEDAIVLQQALLDNPVRIHGPAMKQ